MAHIRQRPDRGEGVWQVTVSSGARDPMTGKYHQLSRTIKAGPPTAKGDPPRKVRELVGVLEAEIKERRPNGPATTLGFVLDAYIDRCRRLGRQPKTVHGYESLRDMICDDGGGYGLGLHKVAIGDLDVDDFDDFDGRMEAAGRTVTTRAHYFDFLSQALNMAVDREWINRNPIRRMKGQRPTIQLGHVVPPTIVEVQALIARAIADKDHDLATLIVIAAYLGVRRGELAGVTVGAVDFARRQVVIRQRVSEVADAKGQKIRAGTKTGTVRVVGFDQETELVLRFQLSRVEERCHALGVDVNPGLFLWSLEPDHSVPWRPDGMTHAFTALRDKCGLRHVHLHALRHMAVTRALESGVDVKSASARFGHDPTLMLRRYAHALPAGDQLAAKNAEQGLAHALSPPDPPT